MYRWSEDKSNDWYSRQPWLVGCNFIPSSAINQLEMWQADTYDTATIERELGWAAGLGMNTVRVYLHDLAWKTDASGFVAASTASWTAPPGAVSGPSWSSLTTAGTPQPKQGKQPAPIPGVHNSGWLQSPGVAIVNDPTSWPALADYVRDIVGHFSHDERILMWDLYNEPGNSKQDERSLPFLCKAFEWAREANPNQPLTAGVWYDNASLNAFQLAASDIITFHDYNDAAHLTAQIARLRQYSRPLICTEWMRRGASDVADCLPVFQRERVGCCNWGLVSGKTQTIYPWRSPQGAPEPPVWFHDLLRQDGTPFSEAEVALFRALTGQARGKAWDRDKEARDESRV